MIFIVTNQTVVARGLITYQQMILINQFIIKKIKEINERVYFDDVYICPHHPNATIKKYRINCNCRKPNNGMLLKAIDKYDIDTRTSYMVGDRISDIYAGNSAKLRTVLIEESYSWNMINHNISHFSEDWLRPDFIMKSLWDFAIVIKNGI